MMIVSNRSYPVTALVFLLIMLVVGGCGMFDSYSGRPDDDPVPQTRVLRFKLTPDTVAVKDTVLIHCIIEDSLDRRFEFDWILEEERMLPVDGKLNGTKIRWIAPTLKNVQPNEVFEFFRGVTIDNGSEDSVQVTGRIQIPVINR